MRRLLSLVSSGSMSRADERVANYRRWQWKLKKAIRFRIGNGLEFLSSWRISGCHQCTYLSECYRYRLPSLTDFPPSYRCLQTHIRLKTCSSKSLFLPSSPSSSLPLQDPFLTDSLSVTNPNPSATLVPCSAASPCTNRIRLPARCFWVSLVSLFRMWSLRLVSTVAPSQRVFLALPRAVVLNARPNQFAATKLISMA